MCRSGISGYSRWSQRACAPLTDAAGQAAPVPLRPELPGGGVLAGVGVGGVPPVSVLADGTLVFAPLGELLVVEDGRRVPSVRAGAGLVERGASAGARLDGGSVLGLARGRALCAPVLAVRRRELGL